MENRDGNVFVSQKVILFDGDDRILTIRRTETAPSRPLHWDLPGGDIEIGNDLKIDIAREVREETSIEINNLHIIDAVSGFNDKQEFWITICYTAQPISKEVILSYEHDEYRWVTPEEFLKLKISPRIKKFIEAFKDR